MAPLSTRWLVESHMGVSDVVAPQAKLNLAYSAVEFQVNRKREKVVVRFELRHALTTQKSFSLLSDYTCAMAKLDQTEPQIERIVFASVSLAR